MRKYFDTVIVTETGKPLQNAVIVAKQGGSPVPIYSDEDGLDAIDVLRTDQNGYCEFFAPDGEYVIEYQFGGGVLRSIPDVQIYDLAVIKAGLDPALRTDLKNFGGTATANDTARFSAAITAKSNITNLTGDGGATYALKDLALSHSQSVDADGALFNGVSGGTNLVKLSGFNSRVANAYLSDTSQLSGQAIRFDVGRFGVASHIIVANAKNGLFDIRSATPSTDSVSRANIDACRAESVEGTGIKIGPSVNDLNFSNIEIFGKYGTGVGGYKPWVGSIGWDQNTTPVSGLAVGGHLVNNLVLINLDQGMKLFDAQLSKYSNCIIDGTSDWGLSILGASNYIDFADLYVGTSRGIRIGGTSSVSINGLRTIFNGFVPPGGASDFYDGTAYDMRVEDTAVVRVSNWTGGKIVFVASGAKLIILDGRTFEARSIAGITGGSTAYLSEWGGSAGEGGNVWRAPAPGKILRMQPSVIAAPGAGQSFTYTLRKNFADTSFVATISGASAFGGADVWETTGGIAVTTGDAVALKLVTSGAAAVTFHQCPFQFVPD